MIATENDFIANVRRTIQEAVDNNTVIKIHPLDLAELFDSMNVGVVDILKTAVLDNDIQTEYLVIDDKVYYQTMIAPRVGNRII